MKKLVMSFISILFVLLSLSICIAEEKIIVAAADPYPPFVDPSDVKEGLSLVVIRAAYATQGYTVKMEHVPWARAKVYVIKGDGKYDILPDVWVSEEGKKEMMYSDHYAVNVVKFIKRADDPFEYDGLESLKGKKIGTVRGYTYSDAFRASNDFVREDAVDILTNVKKLIGKRFDLTIEDEIVARVVVAKEDASMLDKIKFTENSFSSANLCISAGLANPRCKEIIEAFNKGLAEIKANGEFSKIFESYGVKTN